MGDLPRNTIGFEDKPQKILNGATLKFEKENDYVKACIKEFLTNFDNRVWGANGPRLLTRVYFASPEQWKIEILNPFFFQYFSWQRIENDCYQDMRYYKIRHRLSSIREKSYVVHLNRHLGGQVVQGSTCDCLLNTFCLAKTCTSMRHCRPLVEKEKANELVTGVDFLDGMKTNDMLSLPQDSYLPFTKRNRQQSFLKIFLYNNTVLSDKNVTCLDDSMVSTTYSATLNLFATFEGRTFEPSEADLFVVPSLRLAFGSSHLPLSELPLKDWLKHFWNYPTKHLFLLPEEPIAKLTLLSNASQTVSIRLPPFNPHPALQPSAIAYRSENWWQRTRPLWFVSSDVSGDYYNDSVTFHAFVKHAMGMNATKNRSFVLLDPLEVDSTEMLSSLQQSLFCPCFFNDDSTSVQRFFDAILSGCIPILPKSATGQTDALPFDCAVDYEEFVIVADASAVSDGSIFQAMERASQNITDLMHRRSKLRKYALILSYGVGHDAHVYQDAFWHVLRDAKDLLPNQ